MKKTKIVLDADVLIHFSEANSLHLLPTILSEYEHVVLSAVYDELRREEKLTINNIERHFKTLSVIDFSPTGAMLREYAELIRTRGRGESACMAYCKFNHDVIGSSNLRDIRIYCEQNEITYLTTFDFLYYAIRRGKMTIDEAKHFIDAVRLAGSKLPDMDIETYQSSAAI